MKNSNLNLYIPNTIMTGTFDDYKGNYKRNHIVYVCTFVSKDGTERFGKLGATSYKTNYRFQKETEYILEETYEFYFKNGVEAFGVESIIRAQLLKKAKHVAQKHFQEGKEELFKIEIFEEVLRHVTKCREELEYTLTEFQDQELQYRYHDYRTELNPWQIK